MECSLYLLCSNNDHISVLFHHFEYSWNIPMSHNIHVSPVSMTIISNSTQSSDISPNWNSHHTTLSNWHLSLTAPGLTPRVVIPPDASHRFSKLRLPLNKTMPDQHKVTLRETLVNLTPCEIGQQETLPLGRGHTSWFHAREGHTTPSARGRDCQLKKAQSWWFVVSSGSEERAESVAWSPLTTGPSVPVCSGRSAGDIWRERRRPAAPLHAPELKIAFWNILTLEFW